MGRQKVAPFPRWHPFTSMTHDPAIASLNNIKGNATSVMRFKVHLIKLLLFGVLVTVLGRPQDDNQVIDNRCDPNRDYMIPHRYDSSKYYHCKYGYRDEDPVSCPYGMEFSFNSQKCHRKIMKNDILSDLDENALISAVLADDGDDIISLWGDEGSGDVDDGSGDGPGIIGN